MTFLQRLFVISLFAISASGLFSAQAEAATMPTCTFTAEPSTVHSHSDVVTLKWTTEHAQNVYINNGIGFVALNGSLDISGFSGSITYTLTAKNAAGMKECRVTITSDTENTVDPRAPQCHISSVPQSVSGNGSVLLRWSAPRASEAVLNQGIGSVPKEGSRVVEGINKTTTFTLNVTNEFGSSSCDVTVYTDSVPRSAAPSCTLDVIGHALLDRGESTVLRWRSFNAVSAQIAPLGTVSLSGELRISPDKTQRYVMVVRGSDGREGFCEKTVEVRGGVSSSSITTHFGSGYNRGYTYAQSQLAERMAYTHTVSTLPLRFVPYTGVDGTAMMLLFSLLSVVAGFGAFTFGKRVIA